MSECTCKLVAYGIKCQLCGLAPRMAELLSRATQVLDVHDRGDEREGTCLACNVAAIVRELEAGE